MDQAASILGTPFAVSCAWAFVQINSSGAVMYAKAGGLEGQKQSVPRSELAALIKLLETRPDRDVLSVYVDCKYLISQYSKPKHTCILRDNADLWCAYHDLVQSKQLTVSLHKVSSHCEDADICSGNISWFEYVGSQVAHSFAKEAARLWQYADSENKV